MNYCTTEKCNTTVAISFLRGLHAGSALFLSSRCCKGSSFRLDSFKWNSLTPSPSDSYLYLKQLIANNSEYSKIGSSNDDDDVGGGGGGGINSKQHSKNARVHVFMRKEHI